MKTNQIMVRTMGCFNVEQRTKDYMFNATALLRQWNLSHDTERKLDNYFASDKTKTFISTIMERENLNTPKLVYLKSRGKYNGGTWMHPMLFIDFAMWIDPEFKYDVLKFVYDQMIFFRKEAGDAYRALGSAVARIVAPNFMKVAMRQIAEGMNWCIFNQHETAIRNQYGTEAKMRELFELERRLASLIEDGFLRAQQDVMTYLRKQWSKKYNPINFIKTEP